MMKVTKQREVRKPVSWVSNESKEDENDADFMKVVKRFFQRVPNPKLNDHDVQKIMKNTSARGSRRQELIQRILKRVATRAPRPRGSKSVTILDVAWIKEVKKNSVEARHILVGALRELKNHINTNFEHAIFKDRKEELRLELSQWLQNHEIDDTYVPDTFQGRTPERQPKTSDSSPVSTLKEEYGFKKEHITCNYLDRPDVILRVGYFCEETGLYKQRCVICEVDGEDKTTPKRDVVDGGHPIKLALKLMTSTSAQAVLQDETYHIRSNFSKYAHAQIQKSLFATTNVELPEFQTLLENLQRKGDDLQTVRTGIHLVHHLLLSHVKIAFLIHMRVLHGIDMLTMDERDTRMRDHYFFVNFEGSHLPEKLVFEEDRRLERGTRSWLQSHWMLHTRVKIKCRDDKKEKSEWVIAPVVNASSSNACMKTWSARVRSMSLPNFPFEENSFMPIACATVQRVNMARLCEIVKKASVAALENFNTARLLDDRIRSTQNSVFKRKILRREFADHCFLTRRQQLDRQNPWNVGNNKLRQRFRNPNNDYLESNFGYEPPERTRDYSYHKNETLNRTKWFQWDQIDVRMYYFDKEMQGTDWEKEAAGMWYIQDYMDFMSMLQILDIEPDKRFTSPFFQIFVKKMVIAFQTTLKRRIKTVLCLNLSQ
jgi:hypothetical protein